MKKCNKVNEFNAQLANTICLSYIHKPKMTENEEQVIVNENDLITVCHEWPQLNNIKGVSEESYFLNEGKGETFFNVHMCFFILSTILHFITFPKECLRFSNKRK